jgi:nucleoside-diphosphate-sugar epimerase
MAKVFITGVNGFVGRNLVKVLRRRHKLTGTDLPPNLSELDPNDPLDPWHNTIKHQDLTAEYGPDLIGDASIVIHCAAKTRIGPSWDDYSNYYLTNITASQRLFEHCQRLGVKKFIYFSSSSVYGNNGQAIQREDGSLNPSSPYAVSKMAAEYALRSQALKGDTELIIVRPFTMYGPHMTFGKYALAIANFIKAWQAGEPLQLEGGGNQRRDYVHVWDAAQAIDLIIECGVNGEVYNIGKGENVSIKQIADIISPNQIVTLERIGAVDSTLANIDRLRRIGYDPQVDILDWLNVYLDKLTTRK